MPFTVIVLTQRNAVSYITNKKTTGYCGKIIIYPHRNGHCCIIFGQIAARLESKPVVNCKVRRRTIDQGSHVMAEVKVRDEFPHGH